jgi:transposase
VRAIDIKLIELALLIRFETESAARCNVDFATIRRGRDRLAVFIATLGWSRATYVEVVTNERLTTLSQEDRRIALKVFWCDMLGRRFALDRPGESLS